METSKPKGRLSALFVASAVAAVWVLMGGAGAGAAGGEPWNGSFEAESVRPPQCTSPVGICTTGTLLDKETGKAVATYDFTMLTMRPTGNGSEMAFTGRSVISKLSGGPGQLFADDEGTFVPNAVGPTPIVIRVRVVRGTGSYDGATGTITATGTLDGTSGATTGTYTGTVSR